jgi:hypothetical protein
MSRRHAHRADPGRQRHVPARPAERYFDQTDTVDQPGTLLGVGAPETDQVYGRTCGMPFCTERTSGRSEPFCAQHWLGPVD